MKMFPDGAGMVALVILVIAVIITIISIVRRSKKMIAVFLAVMLIAGGYFFYGFSTLFRQPYFSQGEALFASEINTEKFYFYAYGFDSAQAVADALMPDAKVENRTITELNNSVKDNTEHRILNTENSRIDIIIHSFANSEEAKRAYSNELEQQKAQIPEGPGFNRCSGGRIAYVVSSIAYDGTEFLFPFADRSGAYLAVCLYLEDSYVFITEKAEEFDQIALPDIINEKTASSVTLPNIYAESVIS